METEHSSYRLGLTEKRARWLVAWLREKSRAGNVTYAWSSAIQGRQGPMTIPTMRVIGSTAVEAPSLEIVPGCQGPWFSLEVDKSWAPSPFSKSSPNKVIAALELLATLIAVKLWIPDSEDRQTSRWRSEASPITSRTRR